MTLLTPMKMKRLNSPKIRFFRIPLLFSMALMTWHCASSRPAATGNAIRLTPKDLVAIEVFTLPDSAQSLLETFGWDTTRFVSEWRKELHFQLRQAGIATTDDTSKSAIRIQVLIQKMERDGGPQITGQASLIKPEGNKSLQLQSLSQKNAGKSERSDPTIDRLRIWSGQMTSEFLRDPKAQEQRKTEYVPQLFMVF